MSDSDFENICTSKANNIHPVTKYRSRSTGLEIIHAEIPGPIVNGYIVLATRTDNDEGIPHTLEHLIFMGSENYPYKGVLDILANKCLASGTNAWTDVDHTCYTLTTAGQNGFCALLPIYLDHFYYPTLTDEAFLLEVHHVNGEGMDGGVVYSELLAKENRPEDKSHVELIRAIYPPQSGYYYNAGGVMKDVREKCTNEKIKKFHSKFYVPGNTRIIVCGIVEAEKLFEAVAPVLEKLKQKGRASKWSNPWLEEKLPAVLKPMTKNIFFAAEDDEDCLVTVAFRGPSSINEVEDLAALRLVFEYLTDSAVGPVQLEFVEQNEPLATDVSYGEMENSQTAFYFEFENVPVEELDSIPKRLEAVLRKQIDGFSMDRMYDVIKNHYQEEMSSMENTPHNAIAYASIADFLYGVEGDFATFEKRINMSRVIQGFLKRKTSDWTSIIKDRILNQPWIIINARPSEKEDEAWIKSEQHRVMERRKILGEPGLKKLEKILEAASEFNQREIPSSVLESIPAQSATGINFHRLTRFQNPDFSKEFNCNVYLDNIKSNFIYVSIHMDTSALSCQQRKYLPLFKEALTESPVMMDDGTVLPFEEVVAALSRNLLSYNCSIGIDGSGSRFKSGSYNHIFCFLAQIQIEKADIGFDWIRRILFHVQWTEERIKTLASKMISDINPMKRKGKKIARTLLLDMLYSDESNTKCVSFLRQQSFLKQIVASLPKSSMEIKKMMESIRLVLTDPKNITIHVASSVKKLMAALEGKGLDGRSILGSAFPTCDSEHVKKLANTPDTRWMQDSEFLKKNPREFILGVKGADSGYLCQGIPGINDFNDPEYPALLLAMQYFFQAEGPFFRAIRGGGFAYGFYIDARPNEGMIYFHLSECSCVVRAYKASQNLIVSHMTGIEDWKEHLVASARSSLSFEVIEGEKTPLQLASSSLCWYYRNVEEGYSRRMIERIEKVTTDELKEMTKKYIAPIFTTKTNCAVVVSPDQVNSVRDGLNKLGKNLQILSSLDSGTASKWSF